MRVKRDFIRLVTANPKVRVADCFFNESKISEIIQHAAQQKAALVLFPELSLTSVSCGDLLTDSLLLSSAQQALLQLLTDSKKYNLIFVVGLPILVSNTVLNVAVVCKQGVICSVIPKMDDAACRLFSNRPENWFLEHLLCGQEVEISSNRLFETSDFTFTLNFWNEYNVPNNQVGVTDLNLYLSNASDKMGLYGQTSQLILGESLKYKNAVLYAAPGFGESTTDLVYSGTGFIAECGELLAESPRFSFEGAVTFADVDLARIQAERIMSKRNIGISYAQSLDYEAPEIEVLDRELDKTPFLSKNKDRDYADAFDIQVCALAQRMRHIHGEKVVIGVSGGLDSTLVLLSCVRTFDAMGLDRKNIIGITMPGFGTSGRTYQNAQILMDRLGITTREISIKDSCIQHFKDINHDGLTHDITYENSQARERTQILMDVANMENALVIGTGDLSELALGWATYNGDHMSMYDLNASIPKTLVQDLVLWAANKESDKMLSDALLDVLATPISPELKPTDSDGLIDQKTESVVGPYELHDFFLFNMMNYRFSPQLIYKRSFLAFGHKYTDKVIKHWLKQFYKRFFMQQFKRSCSPDGPDVTGVSLSPRGGWAMASDASATTWLHEIEQL